LCFNCNGGLGQFRDSIEALLAAASYVDAHLAETIELNELACTRVAELTGVSG
jgi:hypothetical protein